MADPSERFGELLDCGCEQAQGTWFYCPEHQPRTPQASVVPLDDLRTTEIAEAVYSALLDVGVNPGRSNKLGMYAAIKNAVAAVLAQATDTEAGGRVTGPPAETR